MLNFLQKNLLRKFVILYFKIFYKKPKIFDFSGKIILYLPELMYINTNPSFYKFFLENVNIENNKKLLDVGCGTGVLSIFLYNSTKNITCIDSNPEAIKCTKINSILNNAKLEVFESNFLEKVKEKFDYAIFCPPKLSSTEIKRFSKQLYNHLNKNGVLYLILSAENEKLWLNSLKDFSKEIVSRKIFLTFTATILKATKN